MHAAATTHTSMQRLQVDLHTMRCNRKNFAHKGLTISGNLHLQNRMDRDVKAVTFAFESIFPKDIERKVNGGKIQDSVAYKACTKHAPVPLCSSKIGQSTSHHFYVINSSHDHLKDSCKACTEHKPALICIEELLQSMFQCYFVLQSLHRAPFLFTAKLTPGHVPVRLCTTNIAKPGPSSFLYFTPCTTT